MSEIMEGVVTIQTADIGCQWYMINRQPTDSRYLPGEVLVSKVEPIRSLHEEDAYRRNRWRIIRRLDGAGDSFAHRAFAVVRGNSVVVFQQNQNGEQERLARELAAIRPVRDSQPGTFALPSVLLWQNHAKIVEDFLRHTREGEWHPFPELEPQRAE